MAVNTLKMNLIIQKFIPTKLTIMFKRPEMSAIKNECTNSEIMAPIKKNTTVLKVVRAYKFCLKMNI